MCDSEPLPNQPIDFSNCLANNMGRMKRGVTSPEEIDQFTNERINIGKGSRSRYGQLVCRSVNCTATCNVEITEGILVARNMSQAFELIGNCAILRELDMQNENRPAES